MCSRRVASQAEAQEVHSIPPAFHSTRIPAHARRPPPVPTTECAPRDPPPVLASTSLLRRPTPGATVHTWHPAGGIPPTFHPHSGACASPTARPHRAHHGMRPPQPATGACINVVVVVQADTRCAHGIPPAFRPHFGAPTAPTARPHRAHHGMCPGCRIPRADPQWVGLGARAGVRGLPPRGLRR